MGLKKMDKFIYVRIKIFITKLETIKSVISLLIFVFIIHNNQKFTKKRDNIKEIQNYIINNVNEKLIKKVDKKTEKVLIWNLNLQKELDQIFILNYKLNKRINERRSKNYFFAK